MEDKSTRYLIILAAVLCAILIGYNAFYVPDATMSELKVTADSSYASLPSSSDEAYVPNAASSEEPASGPAVPAGGGAASSSAKQERPQSSSQTSAKGGVSAQGKINLNTASAEQLSEGLTGIGDELAKRIVDYRSQHGNFRSVDELKNVSGIGDAKLEAIRGSVTVG